MLFPVLPCGIFGGTVAAGTIAGRPGIGPHNQRYTDVSCRILADQATRRHGCSMSARTNGRSGRWASGQSRTGARY
uniref:Putative secreted protein n=1 Tax=Anopheles darlingi TaxID=43151 RepID=A0A2M4DGB4_ANODA